MSGQILRYPDFDPSVPYQCLARIPVIPFSHPFCRVGTKTEQFHHYQQYQQRLLAATPQCYCLDHPNPQTGEPGMCIAQRVCSSCDMNRTGQCSFLHMGWDLAS